MQYPPSVSDFVGDILIVYENAKSRPMHTTEQQLLVNKQLLIRPSLATTQPEPALSRRRCRRSIPAPVPGRQEHVSREGRFWFPSARQPEAAVSATFKPWRCLFRRRRRRPRRRPRRRDSRIARHEFLPSPTHQELDMALLFNSSAVGVATRRLRMLMLVSPPAVVLAAGKTGGVGTGTGTGTGTGRSKARNFVPVPTAHVSHVPSAWRRLGAGAPGRGRPHSPGEFHLRHHRGYCAAACRCRGRRCQKVLRWVPYVAPPPRPRSRKTPLPPSPRRSLRRALAGDCSGGGRGGGRRGWGGKSGGWSLRRRRWRTGRR